MIKKLINRFKRKKEIKKCTEQDIKTKRVAEVLSNISSKMESDSNEFTKKLIELGSNSIKMAISFEEVTNSVAMLSNNSCRYIKTMNKLYWLKKNSKKHRVVKKESKRIEKERIKNSYKKISTNRTGIERIRFKENRKVYAKEERRREREKVKNEQNKNRS